MNNDNVLQFVIRAKDEATSSLKGFAETAGKMKVAFTVAGAAITAALGSTLSAAADAQVEMARFDATLATMGKAGENAKAGLLQAADATLKLGFDNEEAANSLAKLYQRTNDVAKANQLNAIAMDLARAKNISLSDASNAVGMVLSGNGKVLKQFGIDLKETKDPMEQLIELQKRVGGQADAFAKTFAGQKEIVTQNIGEIKEAMGSALLPVVTQLGQALLPIVLSISKWAQDNPKLFSTITLVVGAVSLLALAIGPISALIGGVSAAVGVLNVAFAFLAANPIVLIIAGIVVALGLLGYAIYKLWENWDTVWAKTQEVWGAILTFLSEVFTGLVIMAKERVEKVKLAFINAFYSVRDAIYAIFDAIYSRISGIIDSIIAKIQQAMALLSNVTSSVGNTFSSAVSSVSSLFGGKRADGGPVRSDRGYLVGERGPEMFYPNATGRVSPVSGGGLTVIIQGNSFMSDESAAVKIGDMIAQRLSLVQRI